jgi:hypothetical protein
MPSRHKWRSDNREFYCRFSHANHSPAMGIERKFFVYLMKSSRRHAATRMNSKSQNFLDLMESLSRIFIEELAYEGPRGMSPDYMTQRFESRAKKTSLGQVLDSSLEAVREQLLSSRVVKIVSNGNLVLNDEELRLMVLGVAHLPIVSENTQVMRILELIARSREKGCWSYSMCSTLRIDSKQLFHLSNLLVSFNIIQRFSNVPIPRSLKNHTAATHSSFFILSRFSLGGTDPDVIDVVDPSHSTENVCSLILSLLKEAGGVMAASALRAAVVNQGGFTSKQCRRGKMKLAASNRIETFFLPKSDNQSVELGDDEEESDNEESKFDKSQFVQVVRLLDGTEIPKPEVVQDIEMKTEDDVSQTPVESEPEETANQEGFDSKLALIRNLLRSKLSFRESVLAIIAASGTNGVTTREISRLTGVGLKEIIKSMDLVRAADEVDAVWRNEGRKKYIIFKAKNVSAAPPVIATDEASLAPVAMPGGRTPKSSKGYVTDRTVKRSEIAAEIVASRIALSLADLGRAVEAYEQSKGYGLGSQIDRRTLKKMCELARIPLVEKGEVHSSKLVIAYDPKQIDGEEAMRRVDRPIGMTPKAESSRTLTIKPSLLTPSSVSSQEIKERRRWTISEVLSKGRLAALAVFGKAVADKSAVASFQQAEMYGFIKGGGDVFKAKLLHQYLLNCFGPGASVSVQAMVRSLPLVLFLQVIGCGRPHAYIDAFISSSVASVDVIFSQLDQDVQQHLRSSVPSPTAQNSTPEKQMSRGIALLVKLGLLRYERNMYHVQSEGGGVIGEDIEMDRISFDSVATVEEYWKNLHRLCMEFRKKHGTNVAPAGVPLPLFRNKQWTCKIQVTLAQRRELETLLRLLIEKAREAGHTADDPLVIDASNDDVARVSGRCKLDPGAGLKILKRLHGMSNDLNRDKVVFASMQFARFSCPQCGQLFFQTVAIKRHFETVHAGIKAPENLEEFTRPEYLGAIQRLRTQRKGKRDKRKERLRRRRRGTEARHMSSENHEIVRFFKLACELCNVEPVPSFIEDESPVWEAMARMKNGSSDNSHLLRIKIQSIHRKFPTMHFVRVQRGFVDIDSNLGQATRVLVLHTLFDKAKPNIEAFNVKEEDIESNLTYWNKQGVVSFATRTIYSMSRQGRLDLFGRFNDLDKLAEILRVDSDVVEIVSEDQLFGSVNAGILERMLQAPTTSLECLFDEAEPDEPEDNENEQPDDSEDFTGFRRHIELAGPVSIDRILVDLPQLNNTSVFARKFIEEILKIHASSRSLVWRPNQIAPADQVMNEDGSGPVTRVWTKKELNIPIFEFGTIKVRNDTRADRDPFLHALISVSPNAFLLYSQVGVDVPLTAWISMDGHIRSSMIACVLFNILSIIFSYPGVSLQSLHTRLRLLSLAEIRFLVTVWKDSGIVASQGDDQLFLNPVYQW